MRRGGGKAVGGVGTVVPAPALPPAPRPPPDSSSHSHLPAFACAFPPRPRVPLSCIQAPERELPAEDETRSFCILGRGPGRSQQHRCLWGPRASKLLPTPLETLLRCQWPRRRPHLEATRLKQIGANGNGPHLAFCPCPTRSSPSHTPDLSPGRRPFSALLVGCQTSQGSQLLCVRSDL